MLNSLFKTRGQADPSRGIMLVEMLVAFGIVSVTFVVIVDAYLASSRATQIAQRQAEVADALAYALADMAREAQLSTNYVYNSSAPAYIEMERTASVSGIPAATIRYTHDDTRLVKSVDGVAFDLLPPNIDLDDFPGLRSQNPDRLFVRLVAKHQEAGELESDMSVQATFVSRVEL